MRRRILNLAVVAIILVPGAAMAWVHEGEVAPDFTKDELGAPPPAARSLSDYAGKVVLIFLLGCT